MSELDRFAIDDRMATQGSAALLASRATGRVVPWILRTKVARGLPMIPVNEFPKAGGTWFAQVLATYLGIPLPQRAMTPYLMRCVVHGHHVPPMPDGFLIVRDPRACYVSLYFHRVWLVRANASNRHYLSVRERWRSALGIDPATTDPSVGLPRYVEALLSGNPLGEPSWDHFYTAWLKEAARGSAVTVRYEDLRTDPLAQFATAIEQRFGDVDLDRLRPSINRYDFNLVRKGHSGANAFARRGEVDGWRRDVPEHLHTTLDHLLTEVSDEYGYRGGTTE